jgi:23S rRNA-/tRNA-specific pseudouridylate synthase
MATSPAARHHLIEQLKAHTMKREYVAFVEGRVNPPKGTWRQRLQLSRDELRQRVLSETAAQAHGAEASEAITHYEAATEYPLAGGKGFITKLRLRLETGRKHQIRVQAAHAGLPLVGDRTYNPAWRSETLPKPVIGFPRQALHAEVLTLEHPDRKDVRMTWTAEFPKDLRQLEAALCSDGLSTSSRQ